MGERGQVYAIDILKNVLSSVSSHAQHEGLVNLKTIWADLETPGSTKLPVESLDFVLLVNILFQVKEPQTVLAEAWRLLRFGGQALVVDWQARDEGIGPASSRRLDEQLVRNLLIEAKFQVGETINAGPHHYALVAVK